jgi:hypothetical protein
VATLSVDTKLLKVNLEILNYYMKNSIITIAFISSLILIGCSDQKNNSKPNKYNNGHAYGKNNGELKGKEFGQERASQAHLKNEQKKSSKAKSKNKTHKKDKIQN